MAVYKRNYTRYSGQLTNETWRFAILPRYAIKTIFETKLNMVLLIAGLVPHLIAVVLIYLRSHMETLLSLGITAAQGLEFLTIDGSFFYNLYAVETFLTFFLIALVGPGLVSPDLTNNALPLYLSRPFSRSEYVIGKLSVLVALTSLTTWVPGLILVLVQTSLIGFSWLTDNLRIVAGIVVGSWIWILTISLIALALSAWVKWKPVAAAGLFGVFFVAAGFGTAANALLEMRWGTLLNLAASMQMIWRWLFLDKDTYLILTPPFGSIPSWTGFISLVAVCLAALFMLGRKVRAAQVVR